MMEQLPWQSCFCERELARHFINKDLHSQLISWALWEEYITDLCQTKSTCLTSQPWRWREGKIERCRLLSQKLNACLLGVRNWVYNLCHSGICFSRAECGCGCIMKFIHTLLLNGPLPLQFKIFKTCWPEECGFCGCVLVDSRHCGSVYGEVKQDRWFGCLRGVICLRRVRYRVPNTWQNTRRDKLVQKHKNATHLRETHSKCILDFLTNPVTPK